MSIKIIGDKEFIKSVDLIAKTEPKKLDAALARMAFATDKDAKMSIQGSPATGRAYKRRSITHIASSPGNAPRTDTGQLVRNITVKRDGFLNYTVGSRKGAPHGFWLEFGTRFIAKRPWLTPAYNKVIGKFKEYFR